jgi:hypothetical protein
MEIIDRKDRIMKKFKIQLPKFIRRKLMEREFKQKCLHVFPCQCCAYYRHRGKYADQCEMGEKLLKKYNLT